MEKDRAVSSRWLDVFLKDLFNEIGLEDEEGRTLLSEWVSSPQGFEEQRQTIFQKLPNERMREVFDQVLVPRLRAGRELVARDHPPCRTREHVDLLFKAYGWLDAQERERKVDQFIDELHDYPHIKTWILGLEKDKALHLNVGDPDFARHYAGRYPNVVRSKEFRELVGHQERIIREHPIFVEYLQRHRRDLLAALRWPSQALLELERLDLKLPPSHRQASAGGDVIPEIRELTKKLTRLMEEREATKADLIRRGVEPGSDDYERVVNVFEARIARLTEDEE